MWDPSPRCASATANSMYSLAVKPSVDRVFAKLSMRDKKQMEAIYKKIDEILENPQHYKNLKNRFITGNEYTLEASF